MIALSFFAGPQRPRFFFVGEIDKDIYYAIIEHGTIFLKGVCHEAIPDLCTRRIARRGP